MINVIIIIPKKIL